MRRRGPGQSVARLGAPERGEPYVKKNDHLVWAEKLTSPQKSARVLRRPAFGWGFRTWRREALNGIFAALCVTGSWGAMNTMLAMIEFFAKSGVI